MRVLKRFARKIVYPSRRGGSTDDVKVHDPVPTPLPVEDDLPFTLRARVPVRKIFYPSRRGGSADNNDAINPIGVEDDGWVPPRQRQWKNAAAFSDDEQYVNNCAEDYLWISLQQFWPRSLTAANDDEVIPIAAFLGVEDDFPWLGGTKNWKCALQPVYDDQLATASSARSYVFII